LKGSGRKALAPFLYGDNKMKECCKGHKPEHRENIWMDIHQYRCPECFNEGPWKESMADAQKEWNKMLNKGLQKV